MPDYIRQTLYVLAGLSAALGVYLTIKGLADGYSWIQGLTLMGSAIGCAWMAGLLHILAEIRDRMPRSEKASPISAPLLAPPSTMNRMVKHNGVSIYYDSAGNAFAAGRYYASVDEARRAIG